MMLKLVLKLSEAPLNALFLLDHRLKPDIHHVLSLFQLLSQLQFVRSEEKFADALVL